MNPVLESSGNHRYRLSGDVTIETVAALWKQVETIARNEHTVDISCSGVTRADSSAVAMFLEWKRLVYPHQGDVHVLDLPASMKTIIEVSDLQAIFPYDTSS